MTIVDELIGILGYKIQGAENLKKFTKGMDDAEKSAKGSADKVKKLGIAAGAVATGAIALGVSGFKNFAAFERQMTRIGVTAGATAGQTADAASRVQQLATDFALPIDQAVDGLDTLVSSGQNLEDAMKFLPSVLATAQASGAATNDIANTALKASSALGIQAKDMQHAFDVMVAGGKAGQFELRDMAQYLPSLSNSFASLGYKGEDGLKKLIGVLQTLREDTGTAGEAATNAQNIFTKMFSEETEKNFKGFGVNVREEVAKAAKSGEDALSAYLRLTQQVLDKNPTAKISDLFSDQQFQAGMRSLLTSGDSFKKFMEDMSSATVGGGVLRDLNTVISDSQASVDRLSTSWDKFMKSVGATVAPGATSVLDTLTGGIDQAGAMNAQLEKEGLSWTERRLWMAKNGFNTDLQSEKARLGGWQGSTEEERRVAKQAPDAWRVLGRMPQRPQSTPRPIQDTSLIPQTAATMTSRAQAPAPAAPADMSMINELAANLGKLSIGPDFASIAAAINGANANLATMAGKAQVQPVITDARQDNRQFPVSVSAPVTVNVQQPTQAPAAAGAAVGRAVGQAATPQPTRIEAEPSF